MSVTAPVARPVVTASTAAGPRWERPALVGLLVVTALGYGQGLAASGYANSFYAAAVQAGTRSWKALLFGSLDPGNAITVDKPPASLWVMALSGRVFGFSSWSMLLPQALMGVAATALLYAAVRRWSGPGVALASAAVLAATPSAVLIFRFNNPDALLVLFMVAAAYAVVRGIDAAADRAGTWWLVLAGVLLGFGFLTKMLQVMLVVPALVGTYLLVAEVGWGRRLRQLGAATAAFVISAGWYVLLVALWRAAARPYIGGSTDNSLLQLALGYNGMSRLLGGRRGGFRAGAGAGDRHGFGGHGFGGGPGVGRMFNAEFGGNIAWLLPAALLMALVVLWLTRRAPRTDRVRAGLVLWGGWLIVTGLVFSLMNGIVHQYYTAAMAPGLAGCLAVGAGRLWALRSNRSARVTLSLAVLGTAVWSAVLLARTPDFLPWLRWPVLVAGLLGALGLLVTRRRVLAASVAVSLSATAAGVGAYAVDTALTPHQGGMISAGPRVALSSYPRRHGGRGVVGPRGGNTTVGPALTALLRGSGARWAAATVGARNAATMELASGASVMAIGGFSGGDPAPTLAQFQEWARVGAVRYFVSPPAGSRGFWMRRHPGISPGISPEITAWVTAHHTASPVDGFDLYDLAGPAH